MALAAGVDLGKVNLDVSIAEGLVVRFDNTAKGITKLVKHLKVEDVTLAVCEPPAATSGCWSAVCGKPGWRCIWPTQAGCALLPKPVATKPKPTLGTPRCCPATARCFQSRTRRNQILKGRNCRTCCVGAGSLWNSVYRNATAVQRHIAGRRHAHQAPYRLARQGDRRTGPGVPGGVAIQRSLGPTSRALPHRAGRGPLTAAILVAHLPELGHWDAKALTSLVGLAHWSRDSGRKQGQRAIRGGRGIVRRALYLCTWAVVRVDGELRRFYHSLRERGKPGNVAVVAVMRKLLLQLNSVARRGTPWAPQAG